MAQTVSTKPVVKFVDEVPTLPKGNGGEMAAKYGHVLAALKERAGEWAEIATNIPAENRGLVDKLRGYFKNANGCEWRTVRHGSKQTNDQTWTVYARVTAE